MTAYPGLQLLLGDEWKDDLAKESGYDREGGTEGLACYTVTKNVSHLML
jgi:hypothetical protein